MKTFLRISITIVFILFLRLPTHAAFSPLEDSLLEVNPTQSLKIWGQIFGDYYYKTHSDSLKRGYGQPYYSKSKNANGFEMRRVYLGLTYNLHPKFQSEVLLSMHTPNEGKPISFFIKYANIKWKNIWQGSDLILGLTATPIDIYSTTFWKYRSIDKLLINSQGSISYDFGLKLQGHFDREKNYGYTFMVGNGNGAIKEADQYKKFYAEAYGYFFDKKLMLEFYTDFEKKSLENNVLMSENMNKIFVGYKKSDYTIGFEAFYHYNKNNLIQEKQGQIDTIHQSDLGFSVFTTGPLLKNKLHYFAKLKWLQPNIHYEPGTTYTGFSDYFEPNVQQTYAVFGIDYTPIKTVHFMPNIWAGHYSDYNNNHPKSRSSFDLIYRLTFNVLLGN